MEETPLESTQYLDGLDWPANKDEVVEAMARNGAPEDMVEKVKTLDHDRFTGPNDVHNVLWLAA